MEATLAAQNNDNPISILQEREAATAAGGTNTARLRSRIAMATATAANMGQSIQKENFRIFFHVLTQDHSLADLIWSQQTRRELRIALESELEYIRRETEARGVDAIAWNHQQFQVKYPSLDNEVKVGDVYMRLWLQAGDGFIRSWDEPVRLFEHLFRRFLCEVDRDAKVSIVEREDSSCRTALFRCFMPLLCMTHGIVFSFSGHRDVHSMPRTALRYSRFYNWSFHRCFDTCSIYGIDEKCRDPTSTAWTLGDGSGRQRERQRPEIRCSRHS